MKMSPHSELWDRIDSLSGLERERELKKFRNSALKFTNRIRKALDLEPLEDFVPGSIGDPLSCTINRSIVAEGIFPFVDYAYVKVYNSPPQPDRWGDLQFDGKSSRQFKVPQLTRLFLAAFDGGYYPDIAI